MIRRAGGVRICFHHRRARETGVDGSQWFENAMKPALGRDESAGLSRLDRLRRRFRCMRRLPIRLEASFDFDDFHRARIVLPARAAIAVIHALAHGLEPDHRAAVARRHARRPQIDFPGEIRLRGFDPVCTEARDAGRRMRFDVAACEIPRTVASGWRRTLQRSSLPCREQARFSRPECRARRPGPRRGQGRPTGGCRPPSRRGWRGSASRP